jgi:fructose-1-phosphate kinase PfkB-like protein
MDFERFVLTGSIPADAPEDSYNGWILVDGDEQMRIPVVLLVSGKE